MRCPNWPRGFGEEAAFGGGERRSHGRGELAAVWRPEMPVFTGGNKRGIRHHTVSYSEF